MIEKVVFEGLPNCYRLFNELIELVVTTDIGPRIIRFGFIGQENEFVALTSRGFIGHRLWHAPEARPRSRIPDKDPIIFEQHSDFIRLTQPTEMATGIQKEIDLPLALDKNHVAVVHRLYNRNLWPVELAPWAISVMAPGGKAIIPLPLRRPPSDNNLLPTSQMAIWEYSDLSDNRLQIGRENIILRQDSNSTGPLKIGVMATDGWVAYYNKGHLFVKTFAHKSGALYPDLGSSVEVSTGKDVLELETLAPLKLLQPGDSVEHIEKWFLFRNVSEPFINSDINQHILNLVACN